MFMSPREKQVGIVTGTTSATNTCSISTAIAVMIAALTLAFNSLQQVSAQEQSWDIWLGGTQVTSANKEDVFGNGTVRFAPESNTLFLSNADLLNVQDIQQDNGEGKVPLEKRHLIPTIAIKEKKLTIHLTGENLIKNKPTAPNQNILDHSAGEDSMLEFTGDGSITFAGLDRDKRYNFFHYPGNGGVESEGHIRFAGPNTQILRGGLHADAITVEAGDVFAQSPAVGIGVVGLSTAKGDLRISGGSLTAMACKKLSDRYPKYTYKGASVKPDQVFITGGKFTVISCDIPFGKNVSFSDEYSVLVNNKMTAEGAEPWDRKTPLGETGTPYKFVQVELAQSSQPTTQPDRSGEPKPTTTPKEPVLSTSPLSSMYEPTSSIR